MRVDFSVANRVYCTWFQHHAATDGEICPRRHRTRVKRTRVQTSRNQVHRTWVSFASAIELLVLPFLFLLSPNVVPLSTSKPQKPMNKSNPKQIKPTLHSNVLFSSTGVVARNHTSDLISIAWSFRLLGLVKIGAWVAGFCIVASFFHWSGSEKPHVWSDFHRLKLSLLGLVRIGAWVAGFFIVASFFFVVHLCILISGCWSLCY